MNDYSVKFVRYGLGLSLLGLLLGYLPLAHYLMSDSTPSCPAAPIHGHFILLSLVGMNVFGLLYKALPSWLKEETEPPYHLIKLHFWLSVIGVVGVLINGTIGYEILNHFFQQGFYYIEEEGQFIRNIWFSLDGAFLTIYGAGGAVIFYVFMRYT